jgi:tRNA threonylcarbamoyladenosine biosynthesis protein TsaB
VEKMNRNFLAIDTSCSYLTVVACKGENSYTVFKPDCAMKHSVSVMPAVEEALQKADLTLEECDFFSAVVGAGSFTGIRIGISAVKGLCLAFGKPALPVTSFDVAAYNAIDGEGKLLCLVDALHGSYYVCGYQNGEVVYSPSYVEEAEVLRLAQEGYRLVAASDCPLQGAAVEMVDPAIGLQKAVSALADKGAFGDLNALYIRKSSAELNAEKAEK